MGTQIAPYRCAVLGAGEILDYSRVASLIAPGAFIVCADGGLKHCGALNLRPGLIVGDFDSIAAPAPPDIPRIALPTDKDYTDSFYAASHAIEQGHSRLLLAGMLGGRLDHSLANLQLLARLAGQGISAVLTDGVTDAYALAGAGELIVPHRENCYFSVLVLESCDGVTITGGKFSIENYTLRGDDPRAVSNEFACGDVRVRQKSGILVVISQPIT